MTNTAARTLPTIDEMATAELIECSHDGCRARFFLVAVRDFPTLCIDHAEDARRANGTHHAHVEADRLARIARRTA